MDPETTVAKARAKQCLSAAIRELSGCVVWAERSETPGWIREELWKAREKLCALRMAAEDAE